MKKDNFMKGAFILGAAGILIKIMGAFFRIPLGRFLGGEGIGYYQVGYTVFNFLMAFTVAGLPTAISKLVSEKRAKGDYKGAHKIFKTSFYLLLCLGIAGSLIIALMTSYLVNNIFKSPNAYYAVLAMAPALFFLCILASFRGYFQGTKNMTPTAISQVVEQLVRVVVGILLALYLLNTMDITFAAAGASFGATMGGAAGLAAIVYIYKRSKVNLVPEGVVSIQAEEQTSKQIIRNILKISIPISLGAAVMPLINMLDTLIVLRRLQDIGFTASDATRLFGQLSGMANTLINLPQVLTVAIAVSVVPVVSEAAERRDLDTINENAQSAVKLALLVGLPAAVGLATLATPIMTLLFPDEPGNPGQVLLFLSLAVVFLTQIQTLTGVLQGLGKPHIPVVNLLIGAGFKLVITYVLTGIPQFNVKGAAVGTVFAYFIAYMLNMLSVKKETGVTFGFADFFLKPVLSAGTMGIIVLITYRQLVSYLGNSLTTVLAIGIGGLVYVIMLFKTSAITSEDLEVMPKGEKIINILVKLKLLRKPQI